MLDEIVRAAQRDILFIAAAGNGGRDGVGDNNDTTASYPSNYNTALGAGYDAVIAVAAITSTGAKSSFPNYGEATVYSGASMATPRVTGVAALFASTHPGASASQIKNAILSSAVPTASLTGRCVTGGRLNVSGF